MNMRRVLRGLAAGTVALLATLTTTVATAPEASAAAHAKGVYAPIHLPEGGVEAWTLVHTDCGEMLWCGAYAKIEFKPDNPLGGPVGLFDTQWRFVTGGWAHQGWNRLVAGNQGCGLYRLVVDSYNDYLGEAPITLTAERGGFGVEVPLAGNRKRDSWTQLSPAVHLCPSPMHMS